MNYFLEGLMLGTLLSFSFGPVFFGIIENSIAHSRQAAIFFAFGVFICDALFIVSSYLFAPFITDLIEHFSGMAYVAAVIFIMIGLVKIVRPQKDLHKKINDKNPLTYLQIIAKGILVNGINPALFVFWFSLMNVYIIKSREAPFYFFMGTLMVTFSMDIVKSIMAKKLYQMISFLTIYRVIVISGFVYISFGALILIRQLYFTTTH